MVKFEVFEDFEAFLNREDKNVNGVSKEFVEENPDYENSFENCEDFCGCWNLSGLSDCWNLSDENINPENRLIIPKIENIHQKVLVAVSGEGALEMGSWHTCETTHCRGGWVTVLAGQEGKELEEKTATFFAASAIYRASSNIEVGISKFFIGNQESMTDIKRCAELEASQGAQ